jgi:SpoVK/Ycf46/Vps4 family AAA+-type ATPase
MRRLLRGAEVTLRLAASRARHFAQWRRALIWPSIRLASGSTDGGTSSRVFGSFMSWMQEKTKAVFVVATANDVSKLPPEFLRKGRFDEMFFVDLPDALERAQIWDIVIKRHDRRPSSWPARIMDGGVDKKIPRSNNSEPDKVAKEWLTSKKL